MIYKHTKTGNMITVDSEIKSRDWEPVMPSQSGKPAEEEAKKPAKRTRKAK